MNDRCWQCGKRLMLPYYAQVRDHDGNALRVHKVCLASADRMLRPARCIEVPTYDGRRPPCRDSDTL
jgi:hypothetical protein